VYYVLDKHNNPKPVSAERWAFSFSRRSRRVARDSIGGVDVSTVFLGLDHNFGRHGPPLLFETMAFDGREELMCQRYATWDEAVAGHREIVAFCKAKADVALDMLKEIVTCPTSTPSATRPSSPNIAGRCKPSCKRSTNS
jgi:hypothetical protein